MVATHFARRKDAKGAASRGLRHAQFTCFHCRLPWLSKHVDNLQKRDVNLLAKLFEPARIRLKAAVRWRRRAHGTRCNAAAR